MRSIRIRLVLTAFIASTALSSSVNAEVVFEARAWSPDIAGLIRVDSSSAVDTIDLTGDLGLEEEEAFEGRLVLRPSRRTVVRLGWLPLTLSGDRIISRTITFLEQDFELSTRVESELELEYGRLGFAWQFLSTRDGRFRVGPLLEAKGFRGTATLSAPDLPFPASESEEFEVAFASAGLLLDLEPTERLHFFAEGTVLIDDSEGDLLDAEVGVRFFAAKALAITAGLRRLEIDAEHEGDLLDLELDGVFVGASLHF